MAVNYKSIGVSPKTLVRLKKLKERERKRIGHKSLSWDDWLNDVANEREQRTEARA